MPFLKEIKETYNQRRTKITKRNGLRHAIFSPKSKRLFKGYYIGKWKNDKKEGKGNELDRDGWIFEGDFVNGKRHGTGILSKISEEGIAYLAYIGYWVHGKKQGFGYHWYEDGSYYEGDFWQNKRNGYGQMWYCNGDYYQGRWKNNLYHGRGMFVKANGNRYEGQFSEGKKEGYGIFYHIVTGQEQRGFWKNDSCIRGSMSDIYWRQSAPRPTPYPIPPVGLVDATSDCEIANEVTEDEQVVETITYEQTCKKPPRRIIPDICVSKNAYSGKYPCPCLESVA